MAILGSAIGNMLQSASPSEVTVLGVSTIGEAVFWVFSETIDTYTEEVVSRLEVGDGDSWFAFIAGTQLNSNTLVMTYDGWPLTHWRILQAPTEIAFADGAQLILPQSGIIVPQEI